MQGVRYRFGPFELDPIRKTLRVDGAELRLNGKPFELLLLLVRHAGEVVTREQAIGALWPDTRVHPNSLAVAGSSLRRALQAHSAYEVVETVPRRGYRLTLRVLEIRAPDLDLRRSSEPREIVGRSAELERLHALFARACAGCGALVCISGEPGIGKTALLERARFEFERGEAQLLLAVGRCVELQGIGEPFAPLIEAMSELLRGPSRDAVAEMLASRCPYWCLHHLGHFGSHAVVQKLQREGRVIEASTLTRCLCEALCELSVEAPVVLLLEDLQWADDATLDFLRLLVSRVARERVLVVASFRGASELAIPAHFHDLVHRSDGESVQVLHLGPLQESDVRALVERERPELRCSTELARCLFLKSEGSPLFVVRLLRVALENEALLGGETDEACAALERLFSQAPASVSGFIRQQILGMPEHERALLDAAAVIGEEFQSSTLASVLAVDEDSVEQQLQALESTRQVVARLREEELFDGRVTLRYRFCHALVRLELYALLGVQQRIALHREVAAAFEYSVRLFAEKSRGDHIYDHRTQMELAYHLCRARCFPEAVLAFLRAGDYCDRRFAKREALAYYQRALALLPNTSSTEQALFRLLIAQNMGWARFGLGELEEARCEFRRAGECARLLEAKEAAPATRSVINQGFRYLDVEWEDPLLQRPSAMLADHGTRRVHVLRAEAYFGECTALSRAERYPELLEVAGELLRLGCATHNQRRQAEGLAWLASARLELGQLRDAEPTMDHCLTLAREAAHARALDMASYSCASLHALRGELERAAEELAALCQRTVLSHAAALCLGELGDLRAKQGKVKCALAHHQEAAALRRGAHDQATSDAGWIYRELGQPELALSLDRAALSGVSAGEPRRRRELTCSMVTSYARLGDLRSAERLLAAISVPAALRTSFVSMQPEWRARCEVYLAAKNYGEVEQLAAHWQQSAAAEAACHAVMQALVYRGAAALGRCEFDCARDHVEAALAIHRQRPLPLLALRLLRLRQRVEAARADERAVASAARAADALFEVIDATVEPGVLRSAFRHSALGPASCAPEPVRIIQS